MKNVPEFHFEPAIRQNISLLLGLSGGTGSGKTFSAMRLAKGLSGGKKFCVIDTEAGRANFYADLFQFDRGDLKPPFSPLTYAAAISAADQAGYPVIVVDSASHEWAGEGGILDMQEDELNRLAGDDWKKREAVKMTSWIKPKSLHKALVMRLLQVRAHVILCFRAEQKIEMVREDGKMVVREKRSPTGLDGWIPICEKNLPFELTASFLLLATAPGVPHPIKLPAPHRPFFPEGAVITEVAGERLAEWAAGPKTPKPVTQPAVPAAMPAAPEAAKDPRALVTAYFVYVTDTLKAASDPVALAAWWNSDQQKTQRRDLHLLKPEYDDLKAHVSKRLDELKHPVPVQ